MMQKIRCFSLIEILGGNPNLDFSIKRELPLLSQESTFQKTHKSSSIFSLWKKTTSTQNTCHQLSKIKHFLLIEIKPPRPPLKSTFMQVHPRRLNQRIVLIVFKIQRLYPYKYQYEFNLLLISCLIYLGSKFVFTNIKLQIMVLILTTTMTEEVRNIKIVITYISRKVWNLYNINEKMGELLSW